MNRRNRLLRLALAAHRLAEAAGVRVGCALLDGREPSAADRSEERLARAVSVAAFTAAMTEQDPNPIVIEVPSC